MRLSRLILTSLLVCLCSQVSAYKVVDKNILVIEEGDNLWSIAIDLFGDGYVAFDIWSRRENSAQGYPDVIHPGMRFNLAKLDTNNMDSLRLEISNNNKRIDSLISEFKKPVVSSEPIQKENKTTAYQIVAICLSFIVGILSISLPLFLNSVSEFQALYRSQLIANIFETSSFRRWFFVSLYSSLIAVLIWILPIPRFFFIDGYGFLFSTDTLLLVITTSFVISFFGYIYLIQKFKVADKLFRYLESHHKSRTNPNDQTYFNGIGDLLLYGISKQNFPLTKEISEFIYSEFRAIRTGKKDLIIEYPVDYYSLVFNAIEELSISSERRLIFLEHRTAGSIWLLGEFEGVIISETTYSWMWRNLLKAIQYDKDEMIMFHWQTAHQHVNFRLNSRSREETTEETKKAKLEQRRRFIEFHNALGGLLMYRRKYDLINRFFSYTTSQPPKYELLPNSMHEIFEDFMKFSDQYSFGLFGRYPFPDTEGINGENVTSSWIKKYHGLLYLRQFNLHQYYVNQDPIAPPRLPTEQGTKKFWIDYLPFLEKIVLNLLENQEILDTLNFNSIDKEKPIRLIQEVMSKLNESFERTEITQAVSEEKERAFKSKSAEILGNAMKEYDSINNKGSIKTDVKKWFINGEHHIYDKAAFADNQAADYSNYLTFIAEGLADKYRMGISEVFAMNPSLTYTLREEDISKAIKRLALDNNKHIIISFGLNIPYFVNSDRIDGWTSETINGIELINYYRYNSAFMNQSLFILERKDLPKIVHNNVENEIIDKYGLEPISDTRNIYAKVIDLFQNESIRGELETDKSDEELMKSVNVRIVFNTEIKWQKGSKMIQIGIYHEYNEKGSPDSTTDIGAF